MSHFCVLVIGEDVDGQLAPYQENNMGDCPKEYLKFNDLTTELKEEYENDKVRRLRGPRGGLHSPYDKEFKNPKYSSFSRTAEEKEWLVPEGYTEVEVPLKEVFTFKQFAEGYHGYKKDPKSGRYGYWENPNRKWDWHTIGGRYMGRLKLKEGASGITGKPGAFDNKAEPGFVDQARVVDLDMEGMKAKRVSDRTAYWAEYINDLAKGENRAWAMMRYGIEEGQTREDYINGDGEALSAFAIVKDGKWYERGKMGWWGCVSDEKERDAWRGELKGLLGDLEPDELLTVVDCHI